MYKLVIINGDQEAYDVTQISSKVEWGGRKGSAPRYVKATLMDDDGDGHPRIPIDCANGYHMMLYEDDKELFRGIITQHSQDSKKTLDATAKDNMFYLSNNKDTFVYQNKRADEVFSDALTRCGMTPGVVTNTGYVIPDLVKVKKTYYDTILDALSTTYKATKNRYYVNSTQGVINLFKRSEAATLWVMEVGENITDYSYSKSIEKIKTRVRLLSKDDAVVYEQSNAALEAKIGIFQDIKSIDDTYNDAQMKELVESMFAESGNPEQTLNVSGIGITDVTAGGCVYVVIPHLSIARPFYIDEDTHTFEGNKHTMKVKLNFADDISTIS